MEKSLILETTFLIDLERELARKVAGPAHAFLEAKAEHRLYLTHTIAGELAEGISLADRERWEDFIAAFQLLACNRDVCWEYGLAYRYLQANGLLIGNNDLWIAATALAHRLPVVTRNTQHYRRVPGLQVEEYGAASA